MPVSIAPTHVRSLFSALLVPLLALTLFAACGPSNGDGSENDGRDGGADDGGDGGDDRSDGGGEQDDVDVCDSWPESSAPFELDRFGPGQYSVSAASDGEVLWVGYTRASQAGQGGIQAFGMRIGCDGTPGTPLLLSTAQGDPARGPAVAAVGAKRVLVGWTENDSEQSRLLARYRVLKRDGTSLADTDSTLEPIVAGEKREGSFSSLSVGASSEGFVLAAEMSVAGLVPSRAVIQRLHPDGTPDGETVLADPVDERGQHYPAVAVEPSGRVHLAWETEQRIYRSSLEPGADVFLPSPPVLAASNRVGQWPSASASRDDNTDGVGAAWFAFSSLSDVVVSDATNDSQPVRETFGETQRHDTLPTIAAGTNGGAVAWLRQFTGGSQVIVQRFASNGATMTVGPPVQASTGATASFRPPTITHLSGHTYFVAWIEGAGQDSYAIGRFVTLE